MLVSIGVLATVGTTLAFKVAKKGSTAYCYLETTVAPGTEAGACPYQLDEATILLGKKFYYTTLTANDCAHQPKCIKQGGGVVQ
jgi:hypothetical protein